MLKKYLNKDGSLNYQKLYKDMEAITGFNAKSNREELFSRITNAYNDYKNSKEVLYPNEYI